MRVLLAYDGSAPARTAVSRGGELLAGADAVVVAVAAGLEALEDAAAGARVALPDHVIREATAVLRASELDEARAHAEKGALLAAEAGFASARGEACEGENPVWARLLDAAAAAGADAIVCGTHGDNAVARAVIGSVASGLAHHATLPVLVVPKDAAVARGPIVIGYDDPAGSARLVAACERLLPGRRTVLSHAPRHAGEHRPPAAALIDLAGQLDASLLCVGRPHHDGVGAALRGSVPSALLHEARRPILVVP